MTVQTEIRVGAAVLPRVNLLPPEIEQARRFRRVQFGLGAAVLGAAGVVAALYVGAHGGVASAQDQLDQAQSRHVALQSEYGKYQNVRTVQAELQAKQAMYLQAMSPEVQWSHYLNDLSLTIPDNVWITNMTVTETADGSAPPAPAGNPLAATGVGTITFTGVAFAHDDVATWLESLAKEKGYTRPTFSSSTESFIGSRKIVNFNSQVTLTSDVLSGRAATQVEAN